MMKNGSPVWGEVYLIWTQEAYRDLKIRRFINFTEHIFKSKKSIARRKYIKCLPDSFPKEPLVSVFHLYAVRKSPTGELFL